MAELVRNAWYGKFCLSLEAKQWMSSRGFFDPENLPRHHPILIECVKTLGQNSFGPNSNLVISKVRDKYYLESDRGFERIVTPDVIDIKDPQWKNICWKDSTEPVSYDVILGC